MIERLRRRREQQEGFTLIELLVVVIIIGLLAAIAIPAFLGQREKANDAVAKSLVRNAATAVEAAYVDTQDYSSVTGAMITGIEPNIQVVAAPALAAEDEVVYTGTDADTYSISSDSSSGTTYTMTKDGGLTSRTFDANDGDAAATPPVPDTTGTW